MPRSWLSLFLSYGGWIAVILGGFLVMLTFMSATQLMIADQLDRDGKFAQAVVIDTYSETAPNSEGGTTTRYFTVFRFKDSAIGGADVPHQVDLEFFDATEVGDEVTVRYLVSDPSVLEHDIGEYRRSGNAVRWVGFFVGLGGLWMLWRAGRRSNATILVRRDGEKRMAEVTAIHETGKSLMRRREQGRLVWREEDGKTGESWPHDLARLSKKYKAGDKIVVFRQGDLAFWEGDVGPPWREIE